MAGVGSLVLMKRQDGVSSLDMEESRRPLAK